MAFLNEYTLLSELGKGGFATVYKVRHNELGYIRAVRVLNDTIKDKNEKTYKNFLRECKMLLRLGNGNHHGIVHIYKPDLLPDMLGNRAIVEMDYVDGMDLLHYLAANAYCLPVKEVIRMVTEMSSALAYCHEDIYEFCMDKDADGLKTDLFDGSKLLIDDATRSRLIEKYRVIHNDIHSRNIMRRANGDFVLLDFGLAIEGEEVGVSSSRRKAGALEYLSPEKWEDANVLTTQSDIYSFGVVMYEYLTGHVPFKITNVSSFSEQKKLYEKITQGLIPSIFEMRRDSYETKHPGEIYDKDYPDWLEEAILKCLEKEPAKRFRDAKELYNFVRKHIEEDKEAAITFEANKISQEKNVMIKDLQSEKDRLKDENATLASQLSKTQQELNDEKINRSKSDEYVRKNQELIAANKVLFEEKQSLKDDLNESKVALQTTKERLNKQTSDYNELKKKLTSLENNKGGLSGTKILCVVFAILTVVFAILFFTGNNDSELASKQREIDRLNAKVDELNFQISNNSGNNSSSADLLAKQEEIDNLKSRVKSLEGENSKLRNNSGNNSNSADLSAKQNEIDNLKSQVKSLQNENSKLKKNVGNNSNSADLSAKQREIDQLKSKLAQKENEIRALQEAIRN